MSETKDATVALRERIEELEKRFEAHERRAAKELAAVEERVARALERMDERLSRARPE